MKGELHRRRPGGYLRSWAYSVSSAVYCGVGYRIRLGRRYGFLLAYITLSLACLIFALWRSIPGFYASAIVFGIIMSSVPAIMAAAIGDSMGGKLAPAGLGFITVIFGVGQSLGPAVAGWMKDATGTFTWGFILSAAVSLIGAGGSMILRKKAYK